MGPRLSMLIGLIFGYIEAFGYLNRVVLGANTATIWENKSFFKKFSSWKGKLEYYCLTFESGFIAAGGAMGGFILPMSQPSQAQPATPSNPFTGRPANLSSPAPQS
jgi:hypothetical protein